MCNFDHLAGGGPTHMHEEETPRTYAYYGRPIESLTHDELLLACREAIEECMTWRERVIHA